VILVLQQAPQPIGSGTNNELSWQQQASQVTQEMTAKGFTQLARDWKNFYPGYHSKHPALSVKAVVTAFLAVEVGKGLGTALPKVGTLVGSDVPNAAAKGAEGLNAGPLAPLADIGDFFHRLTEGSTWVRVGEVLGGLLLVYVAIKAITTPGGVPVASRGVKNTAVSIGKKIPGPTRKAVRAVSETDIRRRERAVGIRARHARQGPAPEGRSAPYVIPRGRHAR
jgi:hypothetical protein